MTNKKLFLRIMQPINEDADFQVATQFLPEISSICSNKIRAGILHILVNSPETLHSMKVEELAFRLGIRPRILIHHLERLKEWKLIDVTKSKKYGNKQRRSMWGLDLRYPSWILECYKNIRAYFFSENELRELTSRNKSFRNTTFK